jgi:hypothetical protein
LAGTCCCRELGTVVWGCLGAELGVGGKSGRGDWETGGTWGAWEWPLALPMMGVPLVTAAAEAVPFALGVEVAAGFCSAVLGLG